METDSPVIGFQADGGAVFITFAVLCILGKPVGRLT